MMRLAGQHGWVFPYSSKLCKHGATFQYTIVLVQQLFVCHDNFVNFVYGQMHS